MQHMVSKNINSTIKALMGHENIQTTLIYARSDEESDKGGGIIHIKSKKLRKCFKIKYVKNYAFRKWLGFQSHAVPDNERPKESLSNEA